MRRSCASWITRQCCWMVLLSKAIYVFNSVPIKINGVCWRNGKTDPQIHIELQKFSQVALVVNTPHRPVNTGDVGMQVWSLGQGIPWRRGLGRLSILAWSIPGTAKPGGLQSVSSQKSDTPEGTWHAESPKQCCRRRTKLEGSTFQSQSSEATVAWRQS